MNGIKTLSLSRILLDVSTKAKQIRQQLTLTKVPVRLVPSPLLSASSSINSAIDFLIAVISTDDLVLTALAASASAVVAALPLVALGAADEYAERPSNAPDAAAGAAYRVPKRVAAVNILCGSVVVVGQ